MKTKKNCSERIGWERKFCIFACLFVFAIVWLYWPFLCGVCFKHYKEFQHGPEFFGVLEVLVLGLGTGIALFTYWDESARRRVERKKEKEERRRESKRIQAAFLSPTIPVFHEKLQAFSMALDTVVVGDAKGSAALETLLYEPFRLRELVALSTENSAEMQKINNDFIAACNEIDLEHVAKPLWNLLNWIMYQQLFWDGFSGEGDGEGCDGKSVRDSLLFVLQATSIMPASLQYIFGKYRHLRYNLETLPENGGRILDVAHGYRGTDYADVVFLYQPTLRRLPDSPKKDILLQKAKERDEQETANRKRKNRAGN